MNYYWLIQALGYWSLTLFVVPKEYIKKLLLFSFVGGFIYTWVVQYMAVQIFELWEYKSDLLTWQEIPFFFVMSWFGVTLLYGYLLMKYSKYQLYILFLFVGWTTLANYIPQRSGIFIAKNWSPSTTLMFALFSHIFLLYLLKWINGVEEIGTKDDLLNLK
ncbi:hypothetical protein [Halanaerobacter jeridensis]|uniref:Uncharacterized protein n=1 Tax=Halanaerobacter jeridensis TaxID=706427 RepID=A0A938XSC6_9FIRM|nr:hypothetical protein [Halanaerobacter jeridensis]MBM7556600.1 hypothetical protein [Halanaerobacter jeridensis]